jgi:hypothetical protein
VMIAATAGGPAIFVPIHGITSIALRPKEHRGLSARHNGGARTTEVISLESLPIE